MARTYVVLRKGEHLDTWMGTGEPVEATSAAQACRRVAEGMPDAALDGGVTLIAIPARNWKSGQSTFAAKTERKLIWS